MSSGGLVTGLSGLAKTTAFQWYGWPGLQVPEDEVAYVQQRLQDEFNATAVLIDDELADLHYNGFSSMLPCLLCTIALADEVNPQIQYYGPCFTTTQERLCSTRARGMRIFRSIACSQEPLPTRLETAI